MWVWICMNKRVPCLRRVQDFVALLKTSHGSCRHITMDPGWFPLEVGSDTLLFGLGALLDLLAAGLCLKYLWVSVIRDGVKTHMTWFSTGVTVTCSVFFCTVCNFMLITHCFWMFLLLFLEVIEFVIIIIWYLNDCNEKESQRPRMLLGAHVALRHIETLSCARELCPVLSDDGKLRNGSGAESADIRVEDIHNRFVHARQWKSFSDSAPYSFRSDMEVVERLWWVWMQNGRVQSHLLSFLLAVQLSLALAAVVWIQHSVSAAVWAQWCLHWCERSCCECSCVNTMMSYDVSSLLQIGTGQLLAWICTEAWGSSPSFGANSVLRRTGVTPVTRCELLRRRSRHGANTPSL